MSAKRVLLLKNQTTPVDPYKESFIRHGFSPQFVPLLDHLHLDKNSVASFLQSDSFIEETSSIIITSQRAVEVLNETMELISDEDKKKLIYRKPAYTVGPATAEILSTAGFQDIRGGAAAGNGTILSEIIIQDKMHKDNMDKQIVFFTGEIRKDIIPKRLLGAKFNLVEMVVYKTALKDNIIDRFYEAANECNEDQNWVIFFSPQGTEVIVKHIRENLNELRRFKIASIGPTTEQYLLDNGIVADIVAKKPEALSLTESISSFQAS